MTPNTLSPELLAQMDAYWRAANYLSVGQLYLFDNPPLRRPLKMEHVKPLVVGHWGYAERRLLGDVPPRGPSASPARGTP